MARIAFIGLGTMGLPMARNLRGAGHELVGCDLDPARVEALGVPAARTAAEAAAGAAVIFTSLPSPAAVEEVVLGSAGVVAGAPAGALFVDVSTGPPQLAWRLAAELEAVGIDSLDAPVSGGPRGAEARTLTIMAGGSEEALARALPFLKALGSLVVRVGGAGSGQAAKLCNNLVAGVTMAALAEACVLAERHGVGARTLYELLRASTGDSRVLRTRFPLAGADASHPASDGYAPLFALDLIAKDLALACELAAATDVDARLARTALEAYGAAQEAGYGSLDYSAVYLALTRPGGSS